MFLLLSSGMSATTSHIPIEIHATSLTVKLLSAKSTSFYYYHWFRFLFKIFPLFFRLVLVKLVSVILFYHWERFFAAAAAAAAAFLIRFRFHPVVNALFRFFTSRKSSSSQTNDLHYYRTTILIAINYYFRNSQTIIFFHISFHRSLYIEIHSSGLHRSKKY